MLTAALLALLMLAVIYTVVQELFLVRIAAAARLVLITIFRQTLDFGTGDREVALQLDAAIPSQEALLLISQLLKI